MNPSRSNTPVADASPEWLEVVRQQVGSLQFGAVEIVVHDSRIVQIEKTERLRFGQAETFPHPRQPVPARAQAAAPHSSGGSSAGAGV